MTLKPPVVRPGDTIGVVAPSWCGPATFPHRVERGTAFLEFLGFKVRFGRHLFGDRGYVSGTPEERAADIHDMFADPEVKVVLAAIGGDHSCHLLPHLDFDLIRRNPKVFMGFSDVTVLNLAIHARTGLVTFNGPALMVDFAEFPQPFDYTVQSFLRTVGEARAPGEIRPAERWTEEFLDWGTKQDLTRPRTTTPSKGWTWLKPGRASGRLVGGCLESMQHLRGTPFFPDLDGAILFFETSEQVPPPSRVDSMLQDYENMGAFAVIRGLLFGRPMGYTQEQKEALHQIILERTKRYSFPVIADMDFGHTSPQFVLPIGCTAEIDTERRFFAIVEPAVE